MQFHPGRVAPVAASRRRMCADMFAGMFAVVASLLGACAGGEPERALNLPQRQAFWSLTPGNPVIRGGDFIDKGLWNDPSVLRLGDKYVMYMTSSTNEPFKPPVLPFRAVSKDGVAWQLEPKAPLMDVSGTPFVSIETPSVVYYRNEYHMYYSGVYKAGSVPAMEIGHAVSSDGIHWRKDARPVIKAGGKVRDFNGYAVAEPGAVVYNDRIYVFFMAMGERASGSPPQLQSIALAISENGTTFDAPRVVMTQSARYPPEAGFPGYSTPSALVDGKTIHLFYDIVHFDRNAKPDWRQVALHHAISTDGGLRFVEDRELILRREDTEWAKTGELNGPAAIIDGDTVKLWFGSHAGYADLGKMIKRGWKGPEFGIGLATAPLDKLRKPD